MGLYTQKKIDDAVVHVHTRGVMSGGLVGFAEWGRERCHVCKNVTAAGALNVNAGRDQLPMVLNSRLAYLIDHDEHNIIPYMPSENYAVRN